MAKRALPAQVRQRIRARRWPLVGSVRFGSLRRLQPISGTFGFDRGQPVDRYYIEIFLKKYSADIQGRVLEVGDPFYTRKFGGDRVTSSEVLHVLKGEPHATIVGNLETGEGIRREEYDCLILVQTLNCIYDFHSALSNCYAALKPGGVILATIPGISQISRYDMDRWGDYWRFTTLSARRLWEEIFPVSDLKVEAYGNVLAAIAFLQGLAAEELKPEELHYPDPDYEMLITVRAVKPGKKRK